MSFGKITNIDPLVGIETEVLGNTVEEFPSVIYPFVQTLILLPIENVYVTAAAKAELVVVALPFSYPGLVVTTVTVALCPALNPVTVNGLMFPVTPPLLTDPALTVTV